MSIQSVLERAEELTAIERRVDPLAGLHPRIGAVITEKETGNYKPNEFNSVQDEYELQLRLHVRYWANSAQKRDARMRAEMALKDLLYRDVVGRLHQIMSMMDSCDRRTLQIAVCDLIDDLKP